ncbi:MAG: BREX-1 system adenine-specific DNA-methyltransferase PglX [Bacteroidales bacterium]|nr:BREX-1 system adenine-specific DNA-methyltransferase PglX [Bacteroidales bacterium]
MTVQEQQANAKAFIEYWTNRGDEKSDTQQFWTNLLTSVFGITEPQAFIEFEKRVKLTHTSFIDAYIPSTKVLIEQKGADIDLRKGYKQSDGAVLTPFHQAKRYANEMPYSSRPRWVVVCNFQEFLVYDMENPNGEPYSILLKNLEKEYSRLSFLTDEGNIHLKREMELSIKAGELVGKIYDALLAQYKDATNAETLKSLNVLCVRLVFLLYAEDAGIFGVKNMFYDYMVRFEARDFRRALIDLFQVLDTKKEDRDAYLDADLAQFPYVNGGLFSKNDIEIPQFTDELRKLILDKASEDFDWSEISPTIFGAVFESTLNPETRRSGGMHYTSIENIHKVIDPLFLNDLRDELEGIKAEPIAKTQLKRASEFQNKLASLKFLDPACGSGNFLTESYLSLRRLENEAILLQTKGQMQMGFEETNPIKVTIHQFYGIEINDFAVSTATTALWIAESQMLKETSKIIQFDLDMLPLKSYHNIKEANALRVPWTEWEVLDEHQVIIARQAYVYPMQEAPVSVVGEPAIRYGSIDLYSDEINLHPRSKEIKTYYVDFDYIMGNPPFVGARLMNESQKQDMIDIFGKKWKNIGNMDYVSGWYLKAAKLMRGTNIRTALVSTNSITQGEQVANLWKPLFEDYGVQIDFAYRTFHWDSEASLKAHVHCVIVGFSACQSKQRTIYTESATPTQAKNINPYLIDAPSVWIESRNKPLCDVPSLLTGSQRIDDDNFIFTNDEKTEFVKKEPKAETYFKVWYGADEFINNRPRWCLYLGKCSPSELRDMPHCRERVEKVRIYRLASKRAQTLKAADYPNKFGLEVIPETDFMIVPVVSSERRRYVPLGFMNNENLCSNQVNLIPNATLYHFGILTSNVHMAWMRVVCGRLKSDYRYSKDIVYNNFPWPTPTEEQKAKIEQTAQAILDVRAKYPGSSLADLYDEVTMPPELRRAHQDNDRAVMAAYGFSTKMSESECVAELFKMYEELVK